MRLYEKYKRFKAGKTFFSIGRHTLKLFNLEFSEDQIMAISEWDYYSDLFNSFLIVFVFIIGMVYGSVI